MQLYGYFRSSAAYRVRIALNLKGVTVEHIPVGLRQQEQAGAAFLQVNPQGLVPVLVDGEHRLSQSLAIIEYLEERFPSPPLLPSESADRARVRAVAQAIACEIHPLNNLRTLRHIKNSFGLDEEGVNRWYRHWIAEGLAGLEAYLVAARLAGRYCHRDQVTLADCCLVPQVFNAQRYACELAPYPTILRVFDACMQLEAFIAAQPSRQPDAA